MTALQYSRMCPILKLRSSREMTGESDSESALCSQIPGKVVSIAINEGDSIKKGDVVCVLESMKMQVSIKAHKDGTVKSIKIKSGGSVAKNDTIAEIE